MIDSRVQRRITLTIGVPSQDLSTKSSVPFAHAQKGKKLLYV